MVPKHPPFRDGEATAVTLPSEIASLSQTERQLLIEASRQASQEEPMSGVRMPSDTVRELVRALVNEKKPVEQTLEQLIASVVKRFAPHLTQAGQEELAAFLRRALAEDPTAQVHVDQLKLAR